MSVTALFALYVAGLATFLSPCVLPLLPSYLAILSGADATRKASRIRAGLGFALGLSVVFVALGMSASAAALTLTAHRRWIMVAAGALMMVFGAKLLGVLGFGALDRDVRPLLARLPSPRGFAGAVLFGAGFALGWTPCVGPVLGATLSYAASHAASPTVAAVQLAAYAFGLATPLVLATVAADRVLVLARSFRRFMLPAQRVMGALLVIMGLLIATDRVGVIALPSFTASPNAQPQADAPCEITTATACSVAPTADTEVVPATIPLGKPHLLEFVGGHCPVCARMAPVIAELERRCTDNDGTVVHANIESPAGRALARRFGIHAVPTLVEIDEDGNETARVIGERTLADLTVALQSVSPNGCRPL